MNRLLTLTLLTLLTLLLTGCSRGKLSLYERGNLRTRVFLDHVSERTQIHGDYYQVKRNKKGQITSAKHYSPNRQLIEKSGYSYNRKGHLTRHHMTEYFHQGPPRISRSWIYKQGHIIQREEKWFTRTRLLEKKLTIHYDGEQKPFLEETWGLGNKIANSTEYYYDFKHRLDKSRRNFFEPDGALRDYWLTIYNDQHQIMTEEHYFPDNTLIAFYRYTYHPSKDFREAEEILDENKARFVTRRFNEFGHLLEEEERTRELILVKRLIYDYDEKQRPKQIRQFDAAGKLVKTSKYKSLRTLTGFRTAQL